MTSAIHNFEEGLARFGLKSFRPGQEQVIASVLAGQDCLCIMPTGGGKSLCYQLPAVLRKGVTLVISPLIALMKDQVDGLHANGLRATFINSSLAPPEQRERLQRMAEGQYDLVYVAPERLRNPRFLEVARAAEVQLLAVDEAHCISEWGHDFRPDYARLGRFRERLGFPPTIALTATATPDVRQDVIKQLQLRSPQIFITGFARPNLRFEVSSVSGGRDKDQELLDLLAQTPGSGIVYASTRRGCEDVVGLLKASTPRRVGLYHAGLLPDERRQVQDRFMAGELDTIVATNAFGMGIDKAELRFVIHYNMPGTLEAYYQEAGRAGRDGQPARCVLLFSHADRYIQEFFIENRYPSREIVRQVYDYLRAIPDDPIEITLQELKERLDLPIGAEGVGVCEQLLEKCGALERLDAQQNMASVKIDSELPTLVDLLPREADVRRKVLKAVEREVGDRRYEWVFFHPQQLAAKAALDRESLTRALRELVKLQDFDYLPPFRGRAVHLLKRETKFEQFDIDFAELDRRKQGELQKLERVIRYARTRRCRQLEILEYFGDRGQAKCGACDACSPEQATSTLKTRAATDQELGAGVHEAVRIALSGAARTQGRVGKGLLAKMLCGSQAAQVTKLNLHRLSTFGLLKDLRRSEVVELLDALLERGLLEQVELDRHRPLTQITDVGREVMRGQQPPSSLGITPELARKLNGRRRAPEKRAKTLAQSPPAPRPPEAAPAAAGPSLPEAEPAGQPRPPHYWTWRLLADGYSVQECAEIRQLDEATIVDHLARAAEEGLDVHRSLARDPNRTDLQRVEYGPVQ